MNNQQRSAVIGSINTAYTAAMQARLITLDNLLWPLSTQLEALTAQLRELQDEFIAEHYS